MSAEDGKKTGDGTGVGLFIPLPASLSKWFPSREPIDKSDPHVTFLYVGALPAERVADFRRICEEVLSELRGPVEATLGPLSHFDQEDNRVAFLGINFNKEMGHIRRVLRRELESNGFEISDRFPDYHPHATLQYLSPGSRYDAPTPDGSWQFDSIEVWGLPDLLTLKWGSGRSVSAKGRYKSKTKDDEGNTHYEYGPRQVSKRNQEKAKKVEKLRHQIGDLRKKVKSDLSSKDKSEVALAVALMDATYERVGNDSSAKDGHFGVTGWQVKHVTFKGGKAELKYVGKSGVKHTKEVKDASLVKALKSAVEGKSDSDEILEIGAKEVNDYLESFGITAKDIRGFHANLEMKKALESIRKSGPELPHGRKEKDKILKGEFEKALDIAAKAVGHESATLRSNYLVPGFEDAYLHDGTVVQKFEKQATKSEAEKEDAEAERLSRPSPKKKPPRKDKRRNRVQFDKDPDIDTGDRGDDPDLTRNYKRVGTHKKTQSLIYTRPLVYGRVAGSPSPGKLTEPFEGRDYHVPTIRRADMPRKLTKKGALEVTASLERLANLFENEFEVLELPKRIAHDLALRLDMICDHLDRTAGFDPNEIAQKETGALEGDSDEPYMSGNFTEIEHSELCDKQESGSMFSADKRAALDALVEAGAPAKTIIAFLKSAGDDEEDGEDKSDEKEDDKSDEKEEGSDKEASEHGFNLFAE